MVNVAPSLMPQKQPDVRGTVVKHGEGVSPFIETWISRELNDPPLSDTPKLTPTLTTEAAGVAISKKGWLGLWLPPCAKVEEAGFSKEDGRKEREVEEELREGEEGLREMSQSFDLMGQAQLKWSLFLFNDKAWLFREDDEMLPNTEMLPEAQVVICYKDPFDTPQDDGDTFKASKFLGLLLFKAAAARLINFRQMEGGFSCWEKVSDDFGHDIQLAKTLLQSLIHKAILEGWLDASVMEPSDENGNIPIEKEQLRKYTKGVLTIMNEYFLFDNTFEFIQTLEEFVAHEYHHQKEVLLSACASFLCIFFGRQVHGLSRKLEACAHEKEGWNLITYNSMIVGLILKAICNYLISRLAQGMHMEAFKNCRKMLCAGMVQCLKILISLFSACADSPVLQNGKEVHGYAVRYCVDKNDSLTTALVDMYLIRQWDPGEFHFPMKVIAYEYCWSNFLIFQGLFHFVFDRGKRQVLVQWTDLATEDANWFSLEDKAVFQGAGSVRYWVWALSQQMG